MAARRKTKVLELQGETDPRAPLDAPAFLKAAAPVLAQLKADLLARNDSSPAVLGALRARHEMEREAGRTGDSYAAWRGHFVEQVAAAWLLSCVFVRTLEDRGLLGHARLAGPGAADSQRLFFELAPSLTERDYLLAVFRELSRFSCTRALFDGEHNPVWLLAPSAEAAKALLALFRAPSADAPAFRFGQPSTRFLGDLYQDLDEDVRKRFALLQTPEFVEEYILDRTLEPAIARFGLQETTLIDPTCGSGHFLLGAFERLFEHRRRTEPGLSQRECVHVTLSAVAGADLNPFAVAIARMRLTLAALEKAEITRLEGAPDLSIRLAVADSLLYNPQLPQLELGMQESDEPGVLNAMLGERYALQDAAAARDVLHRQYAAVVGNPPYITCKDTALREKYRQAYVSAAGKYALSAPFAERFFQLGKAGGFVGMINANSFMKREFGKRLIEDVFPNWNLTRVENTSGAYIPGHGTPTVLLFGTAEPPQAAFVHTILANRGEPTTPVDPSRGAVWSSLVDHGDEVGFENDYITVAQVERATLTRHPWSLGGGGASELKELLEERAEQTLGDVVDSIGIASFTLEDDVYVRDGSAWHREGVAAHHVRTMVVGESIRDWALGDNPVAFFPYNVQLKPSAEANDLRPLWRWRTCLANNKMFGAITKVEGGLHWYEYGRLTVSKLRTPLTITFAFVATHNHFVLDRGGKVFNRSAPIIKLPESATEDDHLALLAYLNSSTACFWMKQMFSPKGMHNASESNSTPYLVRFEFDSTKLERLPVPVSSPAFTARLTALARAADGIARKLRDFSFSALLVQKGSLMRCIEDALRARSVLRSNLVALQEDIDWIVYQQLGLCEESPGSSSPKNLSLGARPFEVTLGRLPPTVGQKSYFAWHGSACELGSWNEFSDVPRATLEHRLKLIDENVMLRTLESPEYKRRWRQASGKAAQELESDEKIVKDQADEWLVQHIETAGEQFGVVIETQQRFVAALGGIDTFLEVASWRSHDPGSLVREVLMSCSVPYLAAHRFTEAGLEKHAEWQHTWDRQRREDAGEKIASVPVPPKYVQKDYRDANGWRLRGKLDVPMERFISYPGCESDEDGEPVFGWAGWDHLQRAQALSALYTDRKDREGWTRERLLPILAGILELLPWVQQWHNEPSDEFDGLRLGDYFAGFLEGELRSHVVTAKELAALRPTAPRRARNARARANTAN